MNVFSSSISHQRGNENRLAHKRKPLGQTSLPQEILFFLFSLLSPKDLARASLTCKEWHWVGQDPSLWQAFDLAKLFPSAVFLSEQWLARFGSQDRSEAVLDKRQAIAALYARCPFSKKKKAVWETHTLFALSPRATIDYLTRIASSPKRGFPSYRFKISFLALPYTSGFLRKMRYTLIFNKALKQKKYEAIASLMNYEVPDLVTITAFKLIKSVKAEKRKKRKKQITATLCREKTDKGIPLAVKRTEKGLEIKELSRGNHQAIGRLLAKSLPTLKNKDQGSPSAES